MSHVDKSFILQLGWKLATLKSTNFCEDESSKFWPLQYLWKTFNKIPEKDHDETFFITVGGYMQPTLLKMTKTLIFQWESFDTFIKSTTANASSIYLYYKFDKNMFKIIIFSHSDFLDINL